jgi:hypothetical protein
LGEYRVAHFLDDFQLMITGLTAIFIDRHSMFLNRSVAAAMLFRTPRNRGILPYWGWYTTFQDRISPSRPVSRFWCGKPHRMPAGDSVALPIP